MINNSNHLRANLRLIRDVMKLSQSDMARRLHMSRSCYAALETGMRSPTCDDLFIITRFTGIDADCFVSHNLRHELICQLMTSDVADTEVFMREYMKLSARGRELIGRYMDILLDEEDALCQNAAHCCSKGCR